MARLPKIPRGLSTRIKKLERKLEQKKKVDARKKLIASMRSKAEALRKKL